MKKHHTDLFRVICPAEKSKEIKDYLVRLGCHIDEDSVDAATVLPMLTPQTALSGARYRENLTQKQLADLVGISRAHLSEMERGKRAISADHAQRLAMALNIAPQRLLEHGQA